MMILMSTLFNGLAYLYDAFRDDNLLASQAALEIILNSLFPCPELQLESKNKFINEKIIGAKYLYL